LAATERPSQQIRALEQEWHRLATQVRSEMEAARARLSDLTIAEQIATAEMAARMCDWLVSQREEACEHFRDDSPGALTQQQRAATEILRESRRSIRSSRREQRGRSAELKERYSRLSALVVSVQNSIHRRRWNAAQGADEKGV